MSVSLTWVDAFTDRPFAGNPAGVCLLEEPLPVSTMQSLATELGIAETAFVTPTDVPGTFGLRWFSPRVEIDLCGHATLAAAHALRAHGVIDGTTPVTFDTRSGALRAAFAADLIELDFPAETMTEAPSPRGPRRRMGGGHGPRRRHHLLLRRGDPDRRSGAAPVLARPGGHRGHRPPGAAGHRRRRPRIRGRLRAAGLRAQCGDRRGPGHRVGAVRGGPLLVRRPRAARNGGAPALTPGGGALTCGRTATGCASGGMPSRCSRVTCAKSEGHGHAVRAGSGSRGRAPTHLSEGGRRQGPLPGRAGPPRRSLRRARRPHPRHGLGDRRGHAGHGPPPAQAPRPLDAARAGTSTRARSHPTPPCAKPSRSSGSRWRIPEGVPA